MGNEKVVPIRKNMEFQFHKYADIFPLMQGEEFESLANSIKANGLREPIIMYDSKILDGRNRYRACIQAGVKIKTKEFEGDDPLQFVIDMNLERRHLNDSQRSAIAAEIANMPLGTNRYSRSANLPTLTSQEQAAKMLNVSTRGVTAANALINKGEKSSIARDLFTKVKEGLIRISAALNVTNREKPFQRTVLKLLDEGKRAGAAISLAKKEHAPIIELPEGEYRVIYADPPWQYADSQQLKGWTGQEDHYPSMSLEQLKDMAPKVKALTAKNSVLLCWATFPLLPDAIELVKAWGFKYKQAFVWDKGVGKFGNYNDTRAELLLVCTHGSCVPDDLPGEHKKAKQVQNFPREEHSRKPDEWRKLIDQLWKPLENLKEGQKDRVELFRRGKAPNKYWKVWGNESKD